MTQPIPQRPYFPIIYVRGYAGTEAAVEETVATPYMGLNLGSTKVRQDWRGRPVKYIFESPLIRLMKDFEYRDVYYDGSALPKGRRIAPKSVVVYRYYDQASSAFDDAGEREEIEVYAQGLSDLILRVRDHVCGDDDQVRSAFRVYLVAHSMGGLICRCFLQNDDVGSDEARRMVDKVFTYATPHNGIDLAVIGNTPGFFTSNNADNFNRKRMAAYLKLPRGPKRVDDLNDRFDADRFFCLVGTNHRDYDAGAGWSRRLVGPMSDGLVRIANATVRGAPRAFVRRSHSGDFGIVNSEEGYQNLVRFLFGDVRVDGTLIVNDLTLPPKVQRAVDQGKRIRASYHFETILRARGARYDLHRRTVDEGSAVFRTFDQMFNPQRAGLAAPRHPHLFSQFLSLKHRTKRGRGSLVFSVDLMVRVPEYEIDGFLFFDDHIEGSYLFRDTITVAAVPPDDEHETWRIRYGFDSKTPGRTTKEAESEQRAGGQVFKIPLRSTTRPGLDAVLELTTQSWNR